MSAFDVEALLAPVSTETPCGENLEYDPDYVAMELAAAGKPEQQFGKTVIPAEEPDWREVRGKATELLSRTKDLRIAVYLTRAATRTEGLSGLADGLALLAGFVEKFWDGVHPQLDPDDNNDPALRVNALASLCDAEAMLKGVREAPLVRSRAIGKINYRDVLVASGELPPPAGAPKTEQATIDGVFADADAGELRNTGLALRRAQEQGRAIEATFADKVGSGNGPLEPLLDLIGAMAKLVNQKMAARGLSLDEPEAAAAEAVPEAAASVEETGGSEQPAVSANNGRKANPSMALTGDISSREDVIRALDKICDYYKRYEPSSPVPLFLIRAKRLASKSFLEILRDLTPDAVNQALAIGGIGDGVEGFNPDANDV